MNPFDPIIDSNFREYADLQLQHHGLLMLGMEQDPEFDRLEDRMTELWEKLDATQRQSVNGMGADLDWIRRQGQPPPKGRRAEEVTPVERQELAAAFEMKTWYKSLYYMRICASTIPIVDLASLRVRVYSTIGFPSYAFAFFRFAAGLELSTGVMAFGDLDRMDPQKALHLAGQVIISPLDFPPVIVALSAIRMLDRDEKENRPIDCNRYSAVLNETIGRLSIEPSSQVGQTLTSQLAASTYQFAASGFEILDDRPAALRCYEEGLKLAPNHETLLIGKGLLLYGNETEKAVEAFRRVVDHEGSTLVWPYFFLTHHYLLRENYNEALKIGEQARARATTNSVQAELFQWQAICFIGRGDPPEVVRPLFEKALSLDPKNERIRRNSKVFEESLTNHQTTNWDIEDDEILRQERAPKMSELALVA